MNKTELCEEIKRILSADMLEGDVVTDEPMSAHTTFRAGGKASFFVRARSEDSLAMLLRFLRQQNVSCYVVGNGSNLLVSDKGYDGVIVSFDGHLADIEVREDEIVSGAGALLSRVASAALKNSLTGLEFASGIPGSIGGAVVMNAGAYGGEMKQVLKEVRVLDEEQKLRVLETKELLLGYRTSIFKSRPLICTQAVISLQKGDQAAIKDRMDELAMQRKQKQPLEFPSAGSTFKRPEGNYAGKLIMEAGLADFSIGGACVSKKHCGFIVNTGGATAADIRSLIDKVREVVFESSGILLEPEVVMIGEF